MENIPADYWLILCIIDYWLAPFTQNHISILTLQSVSTGGLAPGISLEKKIANVDTLNVRVSMPSRAYTSFLRPSEIVAIVISLAECQCPLGLIPHFYSVPGCPVDVTYLSCQCPLGLIPHFYMITTDKYAVNALVCQCPLGLIPHFYMYTIAALIMESSSVNALSGLYLIST